MYRIWVKWVINVGCNNVDLQAKRDPSWRGNPRLGGRQGHVQRRYEEEAPGILQAEEEAGVSAKSAAAGLRVETAVPDVAAPGSTAPAPGSRQVRLQPSLPCSRTQGRLRLRGDRGHRDLSGGWRQAFLESYLSGKCALSLIICWIISVLPGIWQIFYYPISVILEFHSAVTLNVLF